MTQEELQWNLQWTEYERDMLREENDALRKEQNMNEKQTVALYDNLKKWASLGYQWAADTCFFKNLAPEDGESFEEWRERCLVRAYVPDDFSVNEIYQHTESRLRKRYEDLKAQKNEED